MSKNGDRPVYFYGFDYLRILFALFIIAWHIKLLGMDELFSPMKGSNFIPSLSDIIYCNIFLVAVPLFILVSLFLYIFNHKTKKNYFVKRSKHILFLYVFWTLVTTIGLLVASRIGLSVALKQVITLHEIFSVEYILSGGNSVTYFLIEILIMTLIVEVMLQLKQRIKPIHFNILTVLLFGVSCILMAVMSTISGLFDSHIAFLFLVYYSPLNFLPYPFLALILYDLYNRNSSILNRWQNMLIFLVMVLLIIVEWKTLPSNILLVADYFLLPQNSRLSLVFASVLLFVFFINFNIYGGKTVKMLSETTLGVFLLHNFIIKIYPYIIPGLVVYKSNNMPLYYAIIVVTSFVIAYCIKKINYQISSLPKIL
jgi:surface polysaccharide O-acyltransferase-like enzyme